jgi:hypothetical protein
MKLMSYVLLAGIVERKKDVLSGEVALLLPVTVSVE